MEKFYPVDIIIIGGLLLCFLTLYLQDFISSRHNGSDNKNKSAGGPLSMHAEMHAISNACGVGSGSGTRAPSDRILVRPEAKKVLPNDFDSKPRALRDPKSGRKIRGVDGSVIRDLPKATKAAAMAEASSSTSLARETQYWVSAGRTELGVPQWWVQCDFREQG